MNSYLFYRRIRGPVFLLTFGVTALLAEWDVLSFGRSWPLYLIVFGILRLVEGAAFASSAPAAVYPAAGYAPQGYAPSYPERSPEYGSTGFQSAGAASTGLVPAQPSAIQKAGSTQEES